MRRIRSSSFLALRATIPTLPTTAPSLPHNKNAWSPQLDLKYDDALVVLSAVKEKGSHDEDTYTTVGGRR